MVDVYLYFYVIVEKLFVLGLCVKFVVFDLFDYCMLFYFELCIIEGVLKSKMSGLGMLV